MVDTNELTWLKFMISYTYYNGLIVIIGTMNLVVTLLLGLQPKFGQEKGNKSSLKQGISEWKWNTHKPSERCVGVNRDPTLGKGYQSRLKIVKNNFGNKSCINKEFVE